MAKPVITYIDDNVVLTVKGITQGAGYSFTLIVHDDAKTLARPRHGLAAVERGDPMPQEGSALGTQHYLVDYTVRVTLTQNTTDPDRLTDEANLVTADLIKALNDDYQRGGYAIDTTTTQESQTETSGSGHVQVVFPFQVFYRTTFGNPYVLA